MKMIGGLVGKILFLTFILAISNVSRAQGNQANWQSLKMLHSGDKLQVRKTNSMRFKGKLLGVSDAELSLDVNGDQQTIRRQDVQSVKLMMNRHRLRNALILGGVGAGIGAGIGAAAHHGCSSTQTFCLDIGGRSLPAGIGAVVGLLGGTTIGVLLPNHEVVYSVNSH